LVGRQHDAQDVRCDPPVASEIRVFTNGPKKIFLLAAA